MRTRTALLLYAASFLGILLTGLLGRFLTPSLRVWVGAAASALFFGVPAYLGLCEIDGDQRGLLSLRRLSGAQALWLAASGALLVCPMTLISDVIAAVIARFAGAQASAVVYGADGMELLLPMLLASGVIAPVCEEVFFRGYLMGVFARYGSAWAALMTALLFAAVHGVGADVAVYALLGLVFAAYALRAGSVLASGLMHIAYNGTLVLLSVTPLSMLFVGLTPVGCIARLLGCAALCYTVKRAWLARGAREGHAQAIRLSRREMAVMLIALLLVIAAQMTAVLAAGGNA